MSSAVTVYRPNAIESHIHLAAPAIQRKQLVLSVLANETHLLVRDKLVSQRVESGTDSDKDDSTYVQSASVVSNRGQVDVPRGINSGGILFSVRSRWEMV